MTWKLLPLALALPVCLVTATLAGGQQASRQSSEEPSPAPDPLAALGHEVTSGAAPGYVADSLCALCHGDVAETYREVGMSKSFYRPAADRFIEDFEASRFVHEPSGRHYEMVRSGDDLLFRRWEEGPDGQPVNLYEREVDWIMGSGHHSRVYLYRTEWGELFQLPTAWYTQEQGWGMAPGFDRPDHMGVTRPVRRECMFCHNAYPDVPEGSDAYGQPHLFPAELPEGTGCQRCHGPGAEHVRTALGADGTPEATRAAIVNPGRLEPQRRNDVCYECHMQPSVAIPGVRRFDRNDYSFRPGQNLAEYRVRIDVREQGRDPGDRFEINHHPYRLEQSTCFRASDGALSCLTCHDPHRKVPEEERAAHYRAACLECHEVDACELDAMTESASGTLPEALRSVDPGDCVTCHMQERRTEDVVHVTMTDHRIRRVPADPAELLAPREEKDPVLVDVLLADEERAPEGALGQIYRAVAVIRTGAPAAEAAAYLDENLDRVVPETDDGAIIPRLDLAETQLKLHRWTEAEAALREILERSPGHAQARKWLALARTGQGDLEGGERVLREVVEDGTDHPETEFNLGRILLALDRPEEALRHLQRAAALRPNLSTAWLHAGRALLRLDRPAEAEEAFRRSLAVNPDEGRAYVLLAEALGARGEDEEALRLLRHGLETAANPEPVRRALEAAAEP